MDPSQFVRNLIFRAENLGDMPFTFLLAFVVEGSGAATVAWRVIEVFGSGGVASVTYKNKPMFCTIKEGVPDTASAGITSSPLAAGEGTTLVTGSGGDMQFTTPVHFGNVGYKVTNGTDTEQNIGFGFIDDLNAPNPLWVWENFKSTFFDVVGGTPLLKIYMTQTFIQGQLIRGGVGVDPMLVVDLTKCPNTQNYLIGLGDGGGIRIDPVPGPTEG